ncbi:hypothetical protein [Streptomyces millisiae]|uniref:Uncharacterized protein n=1 Tax=Streptomyces millisiae TaxID=3075542 RepID=A0ABU2LLR4_9ACTN|nr:hypothetical protein [Streptomyces sp. DSM 44918]MDT0318535.1 hypothetical protein [Streptomyces sp. DSM 44918]
MTDTHQTDSEERGFHHLLEEHGFHHLAEVAHGIGEDESYRDDDGWQRFDADLAPALAAQVISEILIYIYRAAGREVMDHTVTEALAEVDEMLRYY